MGIHSSSGSKPRLYIYGPKPNNTILDGGSVRMHYISQALEALPVNIRYLDPGRRGIQRLLKLLQLEQQLLNHTNYIASTGYAIPQDVLKQLLTFASPLYFDLHDEPRVQFPSLGIKHEKSHLEKIGAELDANLIRFSNIGLSSPKLIELYEGLDRSKFFLAQNAAEPSMFNPSTPAVDYTIGLTGSTAKNRGADILIKASIIAKERIPQLKLKLALSNIGGLGNINLIRKMIAGQNWISLEEDLSYSNIPKFIASCSACVIPHPRNAYVDTVLPIKFFEYMAAGRAILSTDCPPVADIIRRENAGVITRDTPEALAKGILRLFNDNHKLITMGQNGRRAVEKTYNWKATQTAIIDRIEAVI